MDLYNKVTDNEEVYMDEISIFKLKYKDMIDSGVFKKAPIITPDFGDDENYDKVSDFINSYNEDLSVDKQNNIIEIYGFDNSIKLMRLWHKNALEMSEEEIVDYFDSTTIKGIRRDILKIILHDVIGVGIEWKYN
jgi:hypothetical protein